MNRTPPPARKRTCEASSVAAEPAPVSPIAPIESKLGTLQEQLDKLKAQVRQAQQLAALGTAAATIAHEVNNLLTPIRGYVQTALDSNDPELHKKALTVTMKHTQMLTQMAGRILEIGAAREANRESVALRPVVNDAYASLCRDLAKDGIRFTVDVDDAVSIQADALQLQQVLFNLFLNAREAMAKSRNGKLYVSAVCQGQYVIIVVRNSGPAIPPELLEHIFEPFQTSKPSTREGRQRCGGLGLALCRDLVEENDGTIHVTSDPESGTTFTITLPAARVP